MKKGFTLVELLAVLVILALMSAIIIPNISSVLNNGKKQVASNSTLDYITAVETYLKVSALEKGKIELPENNTYNTNQETVIDGVPYPAINTLIEVSGDLPSDGTITINDNYTVTNADITIGGYKVIYNNLNKIVSIDPA